MALLKFEWVSCRPGAERWKNVLADALLAATGLGKLYERSDASSRAQESVPELKGWLRGSGEVELELNENGGKLALNITEGHKSCSCFNSFLRWIDGAEAIFKPPRQTTPQIWPLLRPTRRLAQSRFFWLRVPASPRGGPCS